MTDRTVNECMVELAILGKALGVEVWKLGGCWEHQIDDNWHICLNAHKVVTKNSDGFEVNPYECIVTFNGWPAASFTPFSGEFVAHENCDEDLFIAAVKAAQANIEASNEGVFS